MTQDQFITAVRSEAAVCAENIKNAIEYSLLMFQDSLYDKSVICLAENLLPSVISNVYSTYGHIRSDGSLGGPFSYQRRYGNGGIADPSNYEIEIIEENDYIPTIKWDYDVIDAVLNGGPYDFHESRKENRFGMFRIPRDFLTVICDAMYDMYEIEVSELCADIEKSVMQIISRYASKLEGIVAEYERGEK